MAKRKFAGPKRSRKPNPVETHFETPQQVPRPDALRRIGNLADSITDSYEHGRKPSAGQQKALWVLARHHLTEDEREVLAARIKKAKKVWSTARHKAA